MKSLEAGPTEEPPAEEEIVVEEQVEGKENKEAMRAEILRLKGEFMQKFKEAETAVRLKLTDGEWLTGITMITKRAEDPKTGQKLALRENWSFAESQHPFSSPDSNDLKLEREYGAAPVKKFGGSRMGRNLERLVLNEQGVFFSQDTIDGQSVFSRAEEMPQTQIENPGLLIEVLQKFVRCLDAKECNFVVAREMSTGPKQTKSIEPLGRAGTRRGPRTEEVTSLPKQPPVPHKKSIRSEPTIS